MEIKSNLREEPSGTEPLESKTECCESGSDFCWLTAARDADVFGVNVCTAVAASLIPDTDPNFGSTDDWLYIFKT